MDFFSELLQEPEFSYITKQDILNVASDFSIYSLVVDVKLNKAMKSPFRQEKKGSFSIRVNKSNGSIYWIDYTTGEYGDCFSFIMKYYNLSFKDCIEYLAGVYGIKKNSKSYVPVINKRRETVIVKSIDIKIVVKNNPTFDYFKQYGIKPETLIKYNTREVQQVWYDDNLQFIFTDKFPIYAYVIQDKFRLYRPLSKDCKWLGNLNHNCVFGLAQLEYKSELLIITKSMKDVMLLHELGYESIAPASEGTLINADIMIKLFVRYKYIYILFDNDEPGINYSNKYVEYAKTIHCNFNLIPIFVDGFKDITDYYLFFLEKQTKNHLKYKIHETNNRIYNN